MRTIPVSLYIIATFYFHLTLSFDITSSILKSETKFEKLCYVDELN